MSLNRVWTQIKSEGPSIFLTIFMLPMILWSAIISGGLFRWALVSLGGGEHMTRDGLTAYTRSAGGDMIHFLNTGSSDAILLESNGRFALVDASEKNSGDTEGYGNYVLEYVKRVAGGKLEFVMGTHNHSDHLGGFEKLLLDPDVTVEKAYLKVLSESSLSQAMVNACEARGIPLLQEELDHLEFSLGNMQLKIFNGIKDVAVDDNAGSMCLLVECGGYRTLLAADMTWHFGREDQVAKEIGGKLDLLKVGHHGYNGSNGMPYLARLQPKTAVYTNLDENITKQVKSRFTLVSNTLQLATGDFGGVAAVFGSDGIEYYAIGEYPGGNSQ